MTLTNQTAAHYSNAFDEAFTAEDLKWIIRLQNEERQSIGNQLRDSVGQVLTCCKLLLEAHSYQQNESKAVELVNKHLKQTINDIMHLSYKMTDQYQPHEV